jgi:hypothetical protein
VISEWWQHCAAQRLENTILLRAEIIFDLEESMRKYAEVFSRAVPILCLAALLHCQSVEAPADQSKQHRVVIGASVSPADSVIAVAPDTSWTASISFEAVSPMKPVDPSTLAAWLKQESAVNGLSAPDVRPWHIVITVQRVLRKQPSPAQATEQLKKSARKDSSHAVTKRVGKPTQ